MFWGFSVKKSKSPINPYSKGRYGVIMLYENKEIEVRLILILYRKIAKAF